MLESKGREVILYRGVYPSLISLRKDSVVEQCVELQISQILNSWIIPLYRPFPSPPLC